MADVSEDSRVRLLEGAGVLSGLVLARFGGR